MKTSNSSIIIDASIFAKWFLPDEHETTALKIKEDYVREDVAIYLPSIIFYEMNNLFRSAVTRTRITKKDAVQGLHNFLQLDFIVYEMEDLQEQILGKAIDLDISSYDASYVVLAEYLRFRFYTTDEKLIKKAKSDYVLSLKSYDL